jgi:hypothetical protein
MTKASGAGGTCSLHLLFRIPMNDRAAVGLGRGHFAYRNPGINPPGKYYLTHEIYVYPFENLKACLN